MEIYAYYTGNLFLQMPIIIIKIINNDDTTTNTLTTTNNNNNITTLFWPNFYKYVDINLNRSIIWYKEDLAADKIK